MNEKERAAQTRHEAPYRAYRHQKTRYVVEAIDPGQRYSVRAGSERHTAMANSCDSALTKHLKEMA